MLRTNCNDSLAVALMARYLAPVPWAYTEAELVFLEKEQLSGEGEAQSHQIQNFISYFENNLSFHLMFHLRFLSQGLGKQAFARQPLTKPPLLLQAPKISASSAAMREQPVTGAPKQSTPAKAAQLLLSPAPPPVAASLSKEAKQGALSAPPETRTAQKKHSSPRQSQKEPPAHQVQTAQTIQPTQISRLARLERVLRQVISESEKQQAPFWAEQQKQAFPLAAPLQGGIPRVPDRRGMIGTDGALLSGEPSPQPFPAAERQAALCAARMPAFSRMRLDQPFSDGYVRLQTETVAEERLGEKAPFASERDAAAFSNVQIRLHKMQSVRGAQTMQPLSAQACEAFATEPPVIPAQAMRASTRIQHKRDFSFVEMPLLMQETGEHPFSAKQSADQPAHNLTVQLPIRSRTAFHDQFVGAPAQENVPLPANETRAEQGRTSAPRQAGTQSSVPYVKSGAREETTRFAVKWALLAKQVSMLVWQPLLPIAHMGEAKTVMAALLPLRNSQDAHFPQAHQNMLKNKSAQNAQSGVVPVSFLTRAASAKKELRTIKRFLQNETADADSLPLQNMQVPGFQPVFINKWITDSIDSAENQPAPVLISRNRADTQKELFADKQFAQTEMRTENTPALHGDTPSGVKRYPKNKSPVLENQKKQAATSEREIFRKRQREESEHDAEKRQKTKAASRAISPPAMAFLRMEQASHKPSRPDAPGKVVAGTAQNSNADFIAALRHKGVPLPLDKTAPAVLRHSARAHPYQGDAVPFRVDTAAGITADGVIGQEDGAQPMPPPVTAVISLQKQGLTQNPSAHTVQSEAAALLRTAQKDRALILDEKSGASNYPARQAHASDRFLRQRTFLTQEGAPRKLPTQALSHGASGEAEPMQRDGERLQAAKRTLLLPRSLSGQTFSLSWQYEAHTIPEKTMLPTGKADRLREQGTPANAGSAPRQEAKRESRMFGTPPRFTQSQLLPVSGFEQSAQEHVPMGERQTASQAPTAHLEPRAAQAYTPMNLLHTAVPGEGKSQSFARSKVIRRKEQVQKIQQTAPPVVTAAQSGFAAEFELPSNRDAVSVEKLADRVYRAIESRLRSEKIRRGML